MDVLQIDRLLREEEEGANGTQNGIFRDTCTPLISPGRSDVKDFDQGSPSLDRQASDITDASPVRASLKRQNIYEERNPNKRQPGHSFEGIRSLDSSSLLPSAQAPKELLRASSKNRRTSVPFQEEPLKYVPQEPCYQPTPPPTRLTTSIYSLPQASSSSTVDNAEPEVTMSRSQTERHSYQQDEWVDEHERIRQLSALHEPNNFQESPNRQFHAERPYPLACEGRENGAGCHLDQDGPIAHGPPTPDCSFKVEGIPPPTQHSSNSTDYDDDETLAVMQSLAGVEVKLKQEDSYSVAPSDEEDMAKLVDSFSAAVPPASVMKGIVYDSANEAFDSTLRGSSPRDTPPEGLILASDGKPFVKAESLDHEVEWDDVLDLLPSLPKDPSLSNLPTATAPAVEAIAGEPLVAQPKPVRPTGSHQRPFKRAPFPNPLLEKSPVVGLTNTSILRTCFRIGEMVNEGCRRYNSQQDVIFELYARVTFSSRETSGRKQNFQFMDLFKEQLPYPTGTLTGWRTGSLLDQQSSVFLAVGKGRMKMCRCICRLDRNRKAEMGWAVVVLAIREVDWDEIEMMKMLVCQE